MTRAYLYRNGYCVRKVIMERAFPSWTIAHHGVPTFAGNTEEVDPIKASFIHEYFFWDPVESRKPHLVDYGIVVYQSGNWQEVQELLAARGVDRESMEPGFYPEEERSA